MSTNKKTLIDGDFQVGSTHFIVDTENSYVGFNNNVPQNKIDVQIGPRSGSHSTGKPLYITGVTSTSGAEFVSDDGTAGIGIGSSNIFTTETNQNLVIAPDGTGAVGIKAAPNPSSETFSLWVQGDTKITGNVNVTKIYGDGSGLTQVPGTQWVTSSEDIYFLNITGSGEGKVAIGTTTPVSLLTLEGTSVGAPPTTGLEGTSNALVRIRDDTNVTLDIGTAGTTTWFQASDATNMGVNYPISLNTNGGNVGVGTITPNAPLEVKKTSGGELFRLTDGTSTIYAGTDANPPWFGTSSNDHLRLITNGTEKVRIESGGNVGIGKTNPGTALDVNGTVTATGFSGNGSLLTTLNLGLASHTGTLPVVRGGTGVTTSTGTGNVVLSASPTFTGTISAAQLHVGGNIRGDGDILMNSGVTFIRANGFNNVAIGENAGLTGQGSNAIAVGSGAGETFQGFETVAVGNQAGQSDQGFEAVAVGSRAGSTVQGGSAVAVGGHAGSTFQGSSAVAIGYKAGETNQVANSIVINATGATLNNTTPSSLVIKPIRSVSIASKALAYTTGTGEITENPNVSFDTNGNVLIGGDIKKNDGTTILTNAGKALTAGRADTADQLHTARTIGGVSFNGSANISLPGVNIAGNQNTTGSAATLTTARTINGVSFNGSANITITANTPQTLTRGTYLTGANFNGGTARTWAVDATTAATASKVVARDGSRDIFARLFRSDYTNQTTIGGAMAFRTNTTDNYIRFCSDTGAIRTFLNVPTRTGGDASGTWGISITGNAATATTATNQSGGTVTCTSGTFSGTFAASTASSRDKFRVYPTAEYCIGMQSGVTFGDLNDWAMTFQMNNDNDRGFWWGDVGHGVNQGAMALSTRGWLNVAERIKVGGGQTDTGAASYPLHVIGDIYATGNIIAYSDKRAKKDINKIENALDKIGQLNGYTYTMNDKRYTGLIAQEVLEVLPEAVIGSEETNYALAYGNMMGLIVEAIKELKEKIG